MHRHGHTGVDGIRIHISHDDGTECDCGLEETHKGVNNVLRKAEKAEFLFGIDLRYLMDALSGIDPEENKKVIFYFQDKDKIVVIQDSEQTRSAVIMPFDPTALRRKELKFPKIEGAS